MEKKDEEIADLQKKINQFKQDTAIATEQLGETNSKLEATEKRATEVSHELLVLFEKIICNAHRWTCEVITRDRTKRVYYLI